MLSTREGREKEVSWVAVRESANVIFWGWWLVSDCFSRGFSPEKRTHRRGRYFSLSQQHLPSLTSPFAKAQCAQPLPPGRARAQILRRCWRRSGSGWDLAGARIAPALVGHRDATTRRLFIAPMPQNWAIKKKGRPSPGQPPKKDVNRSGRSLPSRPHTTG